MRPFLMTLAIATTLASLATSTPVDVFKRQQSTFSAKAVMECATTFFTMGGSLPQECKDAISLPGAIQSVVFNDLAFDFTSPDQWAPSASSSSINANIISLGVPLLLSSAKIHANIIDNKVVVGRIDTPSNSATASGTIVTTSFQPVPMHVPADAHDAFSALFAAVISMESKNVQISGTIDGMFTLPFIGERAAAGIGFDVTNEFKGFNGLQDVTFTSLVSNTPDETNKKQTVTLKLNIKSASTFSFKLGDLLFNTAGPAGPIGTTTLKDVVLKRGDNILTAIVNIDLSLAGAAEFISGLETADATVTLTGTGSSPGNPVILAGVQSIKISVVIPKKFAPKTI